jgi:hypothetical protein
MLDKECSARTVLSAAGNEKRKKEKERSEKNSRACGWS